MRQFILVLGFIITITTINSAQDLHFSQFFLSPLSLNPANTGNFEGSVRLGGIYRAQWFNIPKGYNTYSVSVDAPIIKGFREKDWVGVGLLMFQDVSGELGLIYNGSWLSGSYHFALDKDRSKIFTIGVQGGAVGRRLDPELLQQDGIFLTELQTGMRSTDRSLISESAMGPEQQRGGKTDYSAGLLYQGEVGEAGYMTLGLSVNHISRPRKALITGSGYRMPMRIQAHASTSFALTDKLILSPLVLYQNVANRGSELNLAAIGGFVMNDSKGVVVNFGAGYRVLDAIEVYIGLDYGDFRIGGAYDITTSGLRNASGGAFELAATYIAKIYKKPKVDNILFCPRF